MMNTRRDESRGYKQAVKSFQNKYPKLLKKWMNN